ncbi:MAG: type III pantothenate kinase [Planctomycetota bacterium]|nr:type III pantothenate kinase [Planctomycetota bacterium]
MVLDVGNSAIKYATFKETRRVDGGRLPVGSCLDSLPAARVAAAVSVNDAELERLRMRLPHLRVVGEDIPLQVPVRYCPPEDLGCDRVMSVVGALHRCPEAQGVLVVDLGTCMTFTLGLREEGILGGAILPGPELQSRALAQWTAGLPLVEPARPEPGAQPPAALGCSTAESIRSGLWHGTVGAARELIARLSAESPVRPRVVAVGGGAGLLSAALPEVEAVHVFATLWGVYRTAGDG